MLINYGLLITLKPNWAEPWTYPDGKIVLSQMKQVLTSNKKWFIALKTQSIATCCEQYGMILEHLQLLSECFIDSMFKINFNQHEKKNLLWICYEPMHRTQDWCQKYPDFQFWDGIDWHTRTCKLILLIVWTSTQPEDNVRLGYKI